MLFRWHHQVARRQTYSTITTSRMNIWRLHLNTEGKNQHDFCISRGLLGIGWRVESDGDLGMEEYNRLAKEAHSGNRKWSKGGRSSVAVIQRKMKGDDLVWIRRKDGIYYIGRITGEWVYAVGQDAQGADVGSTRPVEWYRVGSEDEVPGKVASSFRPTRTVQRIEAVQQFSQMLFNELSGTRKYDLEKCEPDIFGLISTDDCEDVISWYLQDRGYSVVPSTCKKSTPNVEFILIHRETRRRAYVQAKTGKSAIYLSNFCDLPGDVHLFAASEQYVPPSEQKLRHPENVIHCMKRDAVLSYMEANRTRLPEKIERWMNLRDCLRGS
jgi:hypothetical protein